MQSMHSIIDDYHPVLKRQSELFHGLCDEGRCFIDSNDLKDRPDEPSLLAEADYGDDTDREHWPSALTPAIFLNYSDDRVDVMWAEASPLSVVYSGAFFGYYDEFCRYFKNTHYVERKGYDQSWTTGDNLWEERKIQKTEMHLDLAHTKMYRQIEYAESKWRLPEYYWLALRPSEKPTARFPHALLDVDNKRRLGFYDRHEDRTWTTMQPATLHPVMYMDLAHLKKLARFHNVFPDMIWCISSMSLGLHLYEKLPRRMTIERINSRFQDDLDRIGAAKTEIYPMIRQAHRRPFGLHFWTITHNAVLSDWREQWDHYCNPGPTPSIDHICTTLLDKLADQWNCWRVEDAVNPRVKPYKALKRFTFSKGTPEEETVFPLKELDRMRKWVQDGFNVWRKASFGSLLDQRVDHRVRQTSGRSDL